MFEVILHRLLSSPTSAISILIAAVAIWRDGSRRSSWMWSAAVVLGVAFVARGFYSSQSVKGWGCDFKLCWKAGSYALEGKDPYTVTGYRPPNDKIVAFVYPPGALPLFKTFALAPLRTAIDAWAVINVVICLGLGLMARRALVAQDGDRYQVIGPSMAALLTAPIILSQGADFGIECGQFSFLVTLALLVALDAQARNPSRPAIPAACLAIASIKIQTMVPFLLLFLRRSDRRTWLLLGIFSAALLLGAGHPDDLPRKLGAMLSANAVARNPGKVNDYSLLNHLSHTMLGFDHAFSRIGIGDRAFINGLSLACIAALGVWLAHLVISRPEIPRGACCSLVSLYSMLFLYHRLYDIPILILPLIYSASRFRTSPGPVRWCYAWVMAAVALAINLPQGHLYDLQGLQPPGTIVRAFVLPCATYAILSAMGALALAVRLDTNGGGGIVLLDPGRPNSADQTNSVDQNRQSHSDPMGVTAHA